MGLWREAKDGWVATVRYATGGRQYTETIPAERLRTPGQTETDAGS
jgi:hypothetical protein